MPREPGAIQPGGEIPSFFHGGDISRYDAYGNTLITDAGGAVIPGSTVGNRTGFQGRGNIAEFGIQNFRNRWYMPQTGTFASRDPLGMIDGPAVYAGFGGNPVGNVDPMGLWWYWNGSSWEWIGSDPRPSTTPKKPENWGHHFVSTKQVEMRSDFISPEAQKHFLGGEDMFTDWPAGALPNERHGRQKMNGVSHFIYENVVGGELNDILAAHKKRGTTMSYEEAVVLVSTLRVKGRWAIGLCPP